MSGSSRIRSDGPVVGASASAPEPAEPPQVTPPLPVAEPEPAPVPSPREPPPDEGHEDQPPAGSEADDKAQKRFHQLTREKYEAEARARAAEQRLAMLQQPQRPQPQPGQSPADAEAEARAFDRFQAQQAAQIFNTACDNLWDEGCREYGTEGMAEAKRALDAVGWGNDAYALQSLTELPDGHRIYRELAADLDNAARILRLPHNKRQIELAWLSNRGGRGTNREPDDGMDTTREPAPVSRAPAPIRPIGARSAPRELPLDHKDVSMAEFIRRRDRDSRPSRIAR